MTDLKNKKVAVLGWGDDTQDCVPWLLSQGADLTVVDEDKKVLDTIEEVKNLRSTFDGLDKFDLIIRNPAVYRYRLEILEAEKAGVEISSKMKLFFDLCPAKIIGVTGTKGKGTTATLIYEILKAAGKDVYLGGNIGTGVFSILNKLASDSWVVLELSSFQLIDLDKSPHVAVVLMVTSEHLDWHPTTKEYVDAKKNIVAHQTKDDFAVVNKDYPNSVEIGQVATGQVTWVSKEALKNMTDDEIRLRGEHNRENVVAAATVAKLLDIKEPIIRGVIKNFKGLEHRLEKVAIIKGVTYYNDSFSTTPETAIAAIKSFTESEIIILGGSSKNSNFRQLGQIISKAKNVKAVILIGVEGQRIKKEISGVKILEGAKDMAEIVKMAYNNATSGDVVLLSPACASFDMFASYKDRGQQFKDQVKKLRSYDQK